MELHDLSVRSRRGHGRGVTQDEDDLKFPGRPAERVIVLIHGFATEDSKAKTSYARFLWNLRAISGDRPPPQTVFVRFYWPGNHSVPLVNQLTYASRPESAVSAGRILGQLIHQAGCREVAIVAHSLGTRVALTALRTLQKLRSDERTSLIGPTLLMAAAVPVSDCEANGDYARERLVDSRQVVMYSSQDAVLALAFRPGEAGWGAIWDQAVGRRGEPSPRWSRREQVKLGHGSYWKSRSSAQVFAEELGCAKTRVAKSTCVQERSLPSKRLDDREPETRSLPAQ